MSVAGPHRRDALWHREADAHQRTGVHGDVGVGHGPSTLYLAQCNADDGGNLQLKKISDGQQTPFTTNAPLLGRVRAEDQSEPQALYIAGMDTVYAVNIESDAEPVNSSFKLPAGGAIFTGLAYDDGTRLGQGLSSKPDFSRIRIWFGDLNGGLWALNDELDADGPVWQAPHDDPEKPVYISSTPVIYKDPQGGATVLFGVWDEAGSNPALYGYDPVTRTAGSIPTGTTFIFAVAPTVINGVIYAGGAKTSDIADHHSPQLFGIRVDEFRKRCGVSLSNRSSCRTPTRTPPPAAAPTRTIRFRRRWRAIRRI